MIKNVNFSRWSRWALCLFAFSLPYELDTPLLQVGVFAVTNVEIVFCLFLLLTLFSVVQNGKRPFLPPRYWGWLGLFFLLLFISTAFAPEFQVNAVKATLRMLAGGVFAVAVMQIVQTRQHVRQIGIALLLGGITAIFLGTIEIWGNAELAWLALFRVKITVVGQFIRLSGPFDYANQAAMFIEATLPLLLALTWDWTHKRQPGWKHTTIKIGLFLMLLFYLEASFLTFSRASFATIAFVAGGISLLLFLRTKRQPVSTSNKTYWRWWAVAAIVTLLLTVLNPLFNNGFRFRVQQLAQEEAWYRARIIITDELQMKSGEIIQIPVSITNEGSLTWRSDGEPPIILGARWLNVETGLQHSEPRWPFATAVYPGESVTMQIPLTAPKESGTYELRWDIVQEQVTWFSEKSGLYSQTAVEVSPAIDVITPPPQSSPQQYTDPFVHKIPIPNRKTLWNIALRMVGERPLFGYGLDNYRLLYGRWLNADDWNQTIHTNNWYLEMLVSVGIVGSLIFFIWLILLIMDNIRTIWHRGDIWQTAIAAAILMFVVHGLLDFFLLFTTTALLFWLLIGLWMATKHALYNEI